MSLKALFLNCSLKASSKPSNTQALIAKVEEVFQSLDVETETIRVVDYKVAFGAGMDEGNGDEWPKILAKIRAAEILIVATPIWLGERSSVAKMVAERLDATTYKLDSRNQREMYGKVGGAVVVGEGDGGENTVRSILYDLTIAGFSIPPNADCFWTGEAGPGGPYLDANGDTHYYTNERARYMAHNITYLAQLLKDNPIPTNLKVLQDQAQAVSRPKPKVPDR